MELRDQRILLDAPASPLAGELSRAIARRGARLVLAARGAGEMRDLARDLTAEGGRVLDLDGFRSGAGSPSGVARTAIAGLGGIDVVVHVPLVPSPRGEESPLESSPDPAAGFAARGRPRPGFAVGNLQASRALLAAVADVMELVDGVLPHIVGQRHGRIVVLRPADRGAGPVNGGACGQAAREALARAAMSQALRGYAEALRRRLRGTGTGVTLATVPPRLLVRASRGTGAPARRPEAHEAAWLLVRAIERNRRSLRLGRRQALATRAADRARGLRARAAHVIRRRRARVTRALGTTPEDCGVLHAPGSLLPPPPPFGSRGARRGAASCTTLPGPGVPGPARGLR